MSNKNKNRNRPQNQQSNNSAIKVEAPQDRPFVFKTDSGEIVKIPAGTVFRPTGRAMSDLSRAMQFEGSKEEVAIAQNAATFDFIYSGFPSDVRESLNVIGAHELSAFTEAFTRHSGVNIPK